MLIFPNRRTERVSNWMLWRWMEIDGRKPGVRYLLRLYVINTPWFGVKLHWFHAPDPDEHCHDHPWWFFSLLLRGRYQERRQEFLHKVLMSESEEQRGPGSIAFRKATDIHRITMASRDCLTLVVNGPAKKGWGFFRPTGDSMIDLPVYECVPWREYLGVPTDTPSV